MMSPDHLHEDLIQAEAKVKIDIAEGDLPTV